MRRRFIAGRKSGSTAISLPRTRNGRIILPIPVWFHMVVGSTFLPNNRKIQFRRLSINDVSISRQLIISWTWNHSIGYALANSNTNFNVPISIVISQWTSWSPFYQTVESVTNVSNRMVIRIYIWDEKIRLAPIALSIVLSRGTRFKNSHIVNAPFVNFLFESINFVVRELKREILN